MAFLGVAADTITKLFTASVQAVQDARVALAAKAATTVTYTPPTGAVLLAGKSNIQQVGDVFEATAVTRAEIDQDTQELIGTQLTPVSQRVSGLEDFRDDMLGFMVEMFIDQPYTTLSATPTAGWPGHIRWIDGNNPTLGNPTKVRNRDQVYHPLTEVTDEIEIAPDTTAPAVPTSTPTGSAGDGSITWTQPYTITDSDFDHLEGRVDQFISGSWVLGTSWDNATTGVATSVSGYTNGAVYRRVYRALDVSGNISGLGPFSVNVTPAVPTSFAPGAQNIWDQSGITPAIGSAMTSWTDTVAGVALAVSGSPTVIASPKGGGAKAISFDGVDDRLNHNSISSGGTFQLDAVSSILIVARFTTGLSVGGTTKNLLNAAGTTSGTRHHIGGVGTTGTFYGWGESTLDSTVPVDTAWHSILVVWNGTSSRIYIDTATVRATGPIGSATYTGGIRIGANSSNVFHGMEILHMRTWNKALTNAEAGPTVLAGKALIV